MQRTSSTVATRLLTLSASALALFFFAGELQIAGAALPGDNGRIVWSIDAPSQGGAVLWSAEPDGSDLVRLASSPEPLGTPSVSANGKFVAFDAEKGGDRDLFIVPIDGSKRARNITKTSGAYEGMPSFGPRKSIAFVSDRDGGDMDVYVQRNWRGRKAASNLTAANPGPDLDPSYAPDGGTVAFTAGDISEDDLSEIAVVPVDRSTPPVELTDNAFPDYQPDFSPDGSKIAFVSEQDDFGPHIADNYRRGIWTMDGDGANLEQVVSIKSQYRHALRQPAFSPGGDFLLYTVHYAKTQGTGGANKIRSLETGEEQSFRSDEAYADISGLSYLYSAAWGVQRASRR